MIVLFLTLTLIALTMLAMAVGVMLSGKYLRGSCGGAECHCLAEGADPKTCDLEARRRDILPLGSSSHAQH